jgi:hypothetical protein
MNNDHQPLKKYNPPIIEIDARQVPNANGPRRDPNQKFGIDIETIFAMLKDPKAAWISKCLIACLLLYVMCPYVNWLPHFVPFISFVMHVGMIVVTILVVLFQLQDYRREMNIPSRDMPTKTTILANSAQTELENLNSLFYRGHISRAEYEAKRQQLLSRL